MTNVYHHNSIMYPVSPALTFVLAQSSPSHLSSLAVTSHYFAGEVGSCNLVNKRNEFAATPFTAAIILSLDTLQAFIDSANTVPCLFSNLLFHSMVPTVLVHCVTFHYFLEQTLMQRTCHSEQVAQQQRNNRTKAHKANTNQCTSTWLSCS